MKSSTQCPYVLFVVTPDSGVLSELSVSHHVTKRCTKDLTSTLGQVLVVLTCLPDSHAHAGVSNFDLNELSKLWQMAHVKPAVIQRNSDPLKPDSLMQHYARLTGMQYQVNLCFRYLHPVAPACIMDLQDQRATIWVEA